MIFMKFEIFIHDIDLDQDDVYWKNLIYSFVFFNTLLIPRVIYDFLLKYMLRIDILKYIKGGYTLENLLYFL